MASLLLLALLVLQAQLLTSTYATPVPQKLQGMVPPNEGCLLAVLPQIGGLSALVPNLDRSLVFQIASALTPYVRKRETPMQFHYLNAQFQVLWNAIAPYHSTAKATFKEAEMPKR